MAFHRYRRITVAQTVSSFPRKMVTFLVGLCIIFVIVQFVKLTTVGRLGAKISKVKAEQQEIELNNEMIKAEISKLHQTSRFKDDFLSNSELQYKDLNIITVIQDHNEDIIAQR